MTLLILVLGAAVPALLSISILASLAGDLGDPIRGIRCLFRGHDPHRAHPLGGFRCAHCKRVEADLEDFA